MNFSLSSDFRGDTSNRQPVTIRLLELLRKSDYQLVQANGQRRMTAPEFIEENSEHAKGAEIFLGRLPRDCYEDELMPMLQKMFTSAALSINNGHLLSSTHQEAFSLDDLKRIYGHRPIEMLRFELTIESCLVEK